MYGNLEVYCTGGSIQRNTGSCLDTYTIDFLNSINADLCFVGASAINQNLELLTFVPNKAKVKQAMIDASIHKVLVTDNSKFNKRSFTKIKKLKDFEIVIANEGLEEDLVKKMEDEGVNIKLV